MSTLFTKVLAPLPVAMPRGSKWAAALVARLTEIGRKVWQTLEATGRARAQRELRGLADRYAHKPEFAATLRGAMHRAAMDRR